MRKGLEHENRERARPANPAGSARKTAKEDQEVFFAVFVFFWGFRDPEVLAIQVPVSSGPEQIRPAMGNWDSIRKEGCHPLNPILVRLAAHGIM